MKRPWSGQVEKTSEEERPDFDPTNPLCPGQIKQIQLIYFRLKKYKFNSNPSKFPSSFHFEPKL